MVQCNTSVYSNTNYDIIWILLIISKKNLYRNGLLSMNSIGKRCRGEKCYVRINCFDTSPK